MEPTALYLRLLLAEAARLEERAWARNPEEAALAERRGEMLAYLMTDSERQQWRLLRDLAAELRKLI